MIVPDDKRLILAPSDTEIYYFLALGTDDPVRATVFQGFSPSWEHLHWVFPLLVGCPSDVFERTQPADVVIAARIGGASTLKWAPQNIDSLVQFGSENLPLPTFCVCFSGEQRVAEAIENWRATHKKPLLHVTSAKAAGALSPDAFNDDALRKHCIETLENSGSSVSEDKKTAIAEALQKWKEQPRTVLDPPLVGHNTVAPNKLSLRRSWIDSTGEMPFIGDNEREYAEAILASVAPILKLREDCGQRVMHNVLPVRRSLALVEPSIFRSLYQETKVIREAPPDVRAAFKHIRTQKGLCTKASGKVLAQLNSPGAMQVIGARRAELDTFSMGVGIHVAQSCAAAIRLGPGVNHVFPALSNFARSVRASGHDARRKSHRLFHSIQRQLSEAVGKERIDFIRSHAGPLEIISDAPIEWMPIDDLPLGLRYDCFRLNATPGNLLMGELIEPRLLLLHPDALRKVLVVSAFENNDPLRNVMRGALQQSRMQWNDKIEFVFVSASNEKDFVEALNKFDGAVMLFDGHGMHNADDPVSKIMIGNNAIDVWSLRNKVSVPPIVLLSACDTHGIDASTHATSANGFIAIGARSVLGTWLPVGGVASAHFFVRLMLRFNAYAPAALAAFKRSVTWTEMISGMLRMYFASEILTLFVAPPAPGPTKRSKMQSKANYNINGGNPAWFDELVLDIAAFRNESVANVRQKVVEAIALTESIRYLHLGRPDTILINDGTVSFETLMA